MIAIINLEVLDTAVKTKLDGLSIQDSKETAPFIVPVIYAIPEEEFFPETFPCFVFYRTGSTRAGKRTATDILKDTPKYDTSGNLIAFSIRESPLFIDVLYIFRLYYVFNTHGVLMQSHFFSKFPPPPKSSYVTVTEGEKSVKYDLMYQAHYTPGSWAKTFGEFNLDKQEDRIYCEQFMYWAEVELDIFERKEVKTVQKIIVNADVNMPETP